MIKNVHMNKAVQTREEQKMTVCISKGKKLYFQSMCAL